MGRKKKNQSAIKPETRREISAILLFTVSGLMLLSYIALAGTAGTFIDQTLKEFMGVLRPMLAATLILIGATLLRRTPRGATILGAILLTASIASIVHLVQYPGPSGFAAARSGLGGGYLGLFLAYPLFQIFGLWAGLVILVALILISASLIFSASLSHLIASIQLIVRGTISLIAHMHARPKIHGSYDTTAEEQPAQQELEFEEHPIETTRAKHEPKQEEPEENDTAQENELPIANGQPPKQKRFGRLELSLDLLEKNGSKPVAGDIRGRQEIIVKTLSHFGIEVELGDVSVGPTVTQYTLRPAQGIKLASITALHNDLALALAAHPIRIEAPIPGKALVGIEVPNAQVSTVRLREMLESTEWKTQAPPLTLVIGRDVSGKPWLADLARMPHMLVAGSTGSGKTVCLNALILSLLYRNGPDDLKLILIDPKRVELPTYNGIPHLASPVITDVKQTIQAFRWAIVEMERRFEILAKAGSRDLKSYNETATPEEKIPYLVIIVDELADLMVAAASEIEGSVIRLAQMARAVGIHLILATQRPSVDVITGLIKANITSRIAFSVASLMDSRTILDCSGAEKLLGRGDMLFITPELGKPKRIQGVFVSDAEIKRVVSYLKTAGSPDYVELKPPEGSGTGAEPGIGEDDDDDPLIVEAKEVIVQAGKASASLLQRRLKVGYARAARILDILEAKGFISPGEGAKPREVLAPRE